VLKKLKSRLILLLNDERGASAIEYGLIAALIAAVIIGAVSGIGEQVRTTFVTICTGLGGTCT
jgi:pilus assembly protein Flp/PilA